MTSLRIRCLKGVKKKKANLSTDLLIIYGNDILSRLLHKYHLRKGA